MSGIITPFTILGDGNLRIDMDWGSALKNGWTREEVVEHYRQHGEWELLEDTLCNSDYELLRPEQVPGALTSAPIIGMGCIMVDLPNEYKGIDYNVVVDSLGLWWFPNYQVEDPWETLLEKDFVVFDLVEQEDFEPNEHVCPDCKRVNLLPIGTGQDTIGCPVWLDDDVRVYAISFDDAYDALHGIPGTAEITTYHAVLTDDGFVLTHGNCKNITTVWQRVAAAVAK